MLEKEIREPNMYSALFAKAMDIRVKPSSVRDLKLVWGSKYFSFLEIRQETIPRPRFVVVQFAPDVILRPLGSRLEWRLSIVRYDHQATQPLTKIMLFMIVLPPSAFPALTVTDREFRPA